MSTAGSDGGSLQLKDTDQQRGRLDDAAAVRQSASPPSRDLAGSDVTDRDWAQQVVDVVTMLSRFVGLELFSDGAALTKALWFWWVTVLSVCLSERSLLCYTEGEVTSQSLRVTIRSPFCGYNTM